MVESILRHRNILKKLLKKLPLLDSLYILHAYQVRVISKMITGDSKTQESLKEVLKKKDINYYSDIFEHYFFLKRLAVELMKYGGIYPSLNLRNNSIISNLYERYNNLDCAITEYISESSKTELNEMFQRDAYRMFMEQGSDQQFDLLRYGNMYYTVFGSRECSEYIKNAIGVSFNDYVTSGLSIFALSLFEFKSKFAIQATCGVNKVLSMMSEDIDIIKSKLISTELVNEDFFYSSMTCLYDNPLVRLPNGEYLCPLPMFVAYWIFEGLYLRLIKLDINFSQLFSKGFENYYIPQILNTIDNEDIKIIDGHISTQGDRTPNSTDWIIHNENHAIFIESKCKGITFISKSHITSRSAYENDITILGKAIAQNYKSIKTHLTGDYPQLNYTGHKFLNLVVTPGDRMLDLDMQFNENGKLHGQIIFEVLEKSGISKDMIEQYPFLIVHSSSLEKMVQIIQHVGLGDFLKSLKMNSINGDFMMRSYINDNFPGFSYRYLNHDLMQIRSRCFS